jgi:hypothetical protein
MCEQMHQTVKNVSMSKAKDIVDEALSTAVYAMQTTVSTTLGSAQGSLAFARVIEETFPPVKLCQK